MCIGKKGCDNQRADGFTRCPFCLQEQGQEVQKQRQQSQQTPQIIHNPPKINQN